VKRLNHEEHEEHEEQKKGRDVWEGGNKRESD
jgi:hypothetical protein